MRERWTAERIEALRGMLANGATAQACADALQVSVCSVQNTVARYRLRSAAGAVATPVAAPDPVVAHVQRQEFKQQRDDRKELIERLAQAEKRAEFWADLKASPVPPDVPRREFGSGLREGCAVALLSDCHVEEFVETGKVSGRNEYNLEIADVRMARFFAGVKWLIEFQRSDWLVRDLILWFGGDLMTGYIHDELIESNLLSPTETVLWLRRRLSSGLRSLLADNFLESIVVPCNYGNHGRLGQKRKIKTGAENSFEWMLYNLLAEDFADEPRVRFEIPRGAHTYVTAYNKTLHFTHGDEVTYAGGIGGLTIPLKKRVPKWEAVKPSDLHFCGHFHQFTDLGCMLVNGSLIGYTEYAMSIGADVEPPQQGFMLLDSKRGKTNVTPIWVGEDL